jgi:predicted porin
MKKTLIAIAALAATSAFAQSSVTIYGQFDAGIYNIKKANATGGSATVYGDGAVFSNVLGFRGTEDMGGGLKAGFHMETDVQTNNGGENQNGQFRRQANGSIAGGFGEIKLGLTTNPIIATNGALMPVSGNSVSTSTSSALGYADFYTKNAVTYTSPAFMGLTAQIQRGMSNNVESASEGSVTAYSLAYVNGPLEVRYAAQDRKAAAANTANSGANPSTATAAATAKESSVFGAKYKIGAFTLGAARLQNETTSKVTGNQMGLGYTTGAWTLGGSLTKAEGSKLTNLQARYALSKRTNLIGMYGIADNSADNKVNFNPVAFNTGSAPAAITDMAAGSASQKRTAIGLGLTHSF